MFARSKVHNLLKVTSHLISKLDSRVQTERGGPHQVYNMNAPIDPWVIDHINIRLFPANPCSKQRTVNTAYIITVCHPHRYGLYFVTFPQDTSSLDDPSVLITSYNFLKFLTFSIYSILIPRMGWTSGSEIGAGLDGQFCNPGYDPVVDRMYIKVKYQHAH